MCGWRRRGGHRRRVHGGHPARDGREQRAPRGVRAVQPHQQGRVHRRAGLLLHRREYTVLANNIFKIIYVMVTHLTFQLYFKFEETISTCQNSLSFFFNIFPI